MPIPVASFFVPRGSQAVFILEDKYIRGGLQIAPNAADRDAILEDNRKPFMLVITEDDGKMWQMDRDLVTWHEFKLGSEGDGLGPRQTVMHTVPEIPPASYADFSLPLGNTVIVHRLQVSAPCILEVHSTPDRIDTNPFRFIAIEGFLEDDGSAELEDGTIVRNRRYHIWANLEDVPTGNVYFRALNTDAENAVTLVTKILFKPVEA